MFALKKPVFVSTFLPFCPVSFWSQLVYGCVRVETRFYLFHGTRSLREVLGRYAPVTAAVALTLDRTIETIEDQVLSEQWSSHRCLSTRHSCGVAAGARRASHTISMIFLARHQRQKIHAGTCDSYIQQTRDLGTSTKNSSPGFTPTGGNSLIASDL